jgi:hypothetical protein
LETQHTWNFKLVSLNVSKGFLRGMFKPSTNFIQFLFSEHLAFWFGYFVSNNNPDCLNFFDSMNGFLYSVV